MLKNNLISVLRGLWKSKVITLINIIGLTVGLMVAVFLLILIKYENSYDAFHKEGNNLYRILSNPVVPNAAMGKYHERTPSAFAEYFKREFPEMADRISATRGGFSKMKINEKLPDERALMADENFLKIFSFKLLKGNLETALAEPNSIVLTRSLAVKIFGFVDPINQTMEIKKKQYKVTGLLEDTPANSTIQFSLLISLNSYNFNGNDPAYQWENNYFTTYIALPQGMSKETFEPRINLFAKKHTNSMLFALQPFLRIHLFSKIDYGIDSKGNITNLIFYVLFVSFILLIAIINFTNISFNQIYKKLNEIGIRRILGSSRLQIFTRSLLESFLISVISFILALLVIKAAIPALNSLINRQIEFPLVLDNILEIGIMLAGVSLLLGLIPAIMMIKQSNVNVLRRTVYFSRTNYFVKWMLVVQFAIAMFFLISTIFVSRQTDLISAKLNINDEEDIVNVKIPNSTENNQSKNTPKEFIKAASNSRLIKSFAYRGGAHFSQFSVGAQKIDCAYYDISKESFDLDNRKITAGRVFDPDKYPSDATGKIVVNESFIKKLNLINPLEARLSKGVKTYEIIGVVENDIYSLKEEVAPAFYIPVDQISSCSFKIDKKHLKAGLDHIKQEWKKFYPDEAIIYSFINDEKLLEYNDEIVAQKLFKIFSAISITLALLGVVGLSSLIMIKKKKEIAIRKVHGAAIYNLVTYFSKEFIIVIGIAFVLAGALSYSYINGFLNNYFYKIDIDLIPFAMALVSVAGAVFITVMVQSLKSLYANPVDSLRSE